MDDRNAIVARYELTAKEFLEHLATLEADKWDHTTYEAACHKMIAAKDELRNWLDLMESARAATEKAKKEVMATINKIKNPLEEFIERIDDMCRFYRRSHEQVRAQEQAALVSAPAGDDLDGMMTQAAVLPKIQNPKGLSDVRKWKAEITDPKALLVYLADKNLLHLVEFNMTELNNIAKSLKGMWDWPGVKAVEDISFMRRRS